MSTLKKFAEAALARGSTIPLKHEELQNIYTLLDNMKDVIEIIVGNTR